MHAPDIALQISLHMAEPRSLSAVNSVHAPKRLFDLYARRPVVLERNYKRVFGSAKVCLEVPVYLDCLATRTRGYL